MQKTAIFYNSSAAELEGKFAGLQLDNDNQKDLTDIRINNWIDRIKPGLF